MSTIEERTAYEKNPYFAGHIYGNFSPFYLTIAVCSIVLGFILILNIVLVCSKHKKYWKDRHTGNRWLVSIWSSTPHLQPPLDFTELKEASYYNKLQSQFKLSAVEQTTEPLKVHRREEYVELQSRQSDI